MTDDPRKERSLPPPPPRRRVGFGGVVVPPSEEEKEHYRLEVEAHNRREKQRETERIAEEKRKAEAERKVTIERAEMIPVKRSASGFLTILNHAKTWTPGHMAIAFWAPLFALIMWMGGPSGVREAWKDSRREQAHIIAEESEKRLTKTLGDMLLKEQQERQKADTESLVQIRKTQTNLNFTYDLASHLNGGSAHIGAPSEVSLWADAPLSGRRETYKTAGEKWLKYYE
jgi:hypothetical protein